MYVATEHAYDGVCAEAESAQERGGRVRSARVRIHDAAGLERECKLSRATTKYISIYTK